MLNILQNLATNQPLVLVRVRTFATSREHLIKGQITKADGSINKEANLMVHAVLGAMEAHIIGNNTAASALGAFTAEAVIAFCYTLDYCRELSHYI